MGSPISLFVTSTTAENKEAKEETSSCDVIPINDIRRSLIGFSSFVQCYLTNKVNRILLVGFTFALYGERRGFQELHYTTFSNLTKNGLQSNREHTKTADASTFNEISLQYVLRYAVITIRLLMIISIYMLIIK